MQPPVMPPSTHSTPAMSIRSALSTIADVRQDTDLVLTNQGSARVWPLLASHPLDFHFNPSTMGGVIPMALGLALAQPQRRVIALSGDGSLLMSLGSLVTVMSSGCTNLSVILLDNNIYDVTGGQNTAASHLDVRYDEMARSIGFPVVEACDDSAAWKQLAPDFLQQKGPSFCWLKVEPALPEDMKTSQEPMPSQLARIRRELPQ